MEREVAASEAFLALTAHMKRHFRERVSTYGLTAAQAHVLLRLRVEAPVPSRALAEAVGIDAGNLTSILDVLEAKDLVSRTPCTTDKRYKLLALTPAGQRRVEQLQERLHADLPLFSGLTTTEAASLTRLLSKAASSAGSAPTPG